MPSSQVHCAGCVVPSGSNANSMPVESNSIHEDKIVSSVPASVTRPGGGLRALWWWALGTSCYCSRKRRSNVDTITCDYN